MASAGALATIGATGATAAPGDGSDVLVVDDALGDNFGDGSLEHPTSSDFYDGVWDLDQFRVGQDSSNIYFDFQMDALNNPFGIPSGWSHEYFQIYIRDPDAPSEAPEGSSGLASELNVDFADPYQYVLLAHPNFQALQDSNGDNEVDPQNTDVTVSGNTVSVSIPRNPISDISKTEIAVLVTPFEGQQDSKMRLVQSSADTWVIGGGDSSTPKVMDMVTPEGVDQSTALTPQVPGNNPELPYIQLGSGSNVPDVAGNTPTNLDSDDLMEDVDGDGQGDVTDVLTYYNNRDSQAIRDNPKYFDYDDDGSSGTVFDAIKLYNKIQGL